MLSDQEILKCIKYHKIAIDPFDDSKLQPASYDVHLSNKFRVFNPGTLVIDPKREQPDLTRLVELHPDGHIDLRPGGFVLGVLQEKVTVGALIAARLEGKSSLARLGLLIHTTSGFVDPGFSGHLTIELSNVNAIPLRLYPGMPIGQLCFIELDTPARRAYGHNNLNSKYQDQGAEPQVSRYFQNFQ